MPRRQEDDGFVAHGFSGVYRVRKESITAARASDDVAAEPELIEKGMIHHGAGKAGFRVGEWAIMCVFILAS